MIQGPAPAPDADFSAARIVGGTDQGNVGLDARCCTLQSIDEMTASCIFCEIVARRAEAVVVFEDSDVVAFMDAWPIRTGHVLVIPREHVSDVFDLSAEQTGRVFEAVRVIGRAIRVAFQPKRVGMLVAGFDVAHAHVHVIPMSDFHDVTSKPLLDGELVLATPEERRHSGDKIIRELA